MKQSQSQIDLTLLTVDWSTLLLQSLNQNKTAAGWLCYHDDETCSIPNPLLEPENSANLNFPQERPEQPSGVRQTPSSIFNQVVI